MSSGYVSSLFGVHGKTALITGGTRGIGQCMALALAKAGADVVLLQRSLENQETVSQIRELGQQATPVLCDLASKEQVSSIVKSITDSKEEGGLGLTIDILVNCGGIQRRREGSES